MRSLKRTNVKNKRVIVRCDFNVPIDSKGKIADDFRIRATLPTINYVLKKGAKIILMSHLGEPLKNARRHAYRQAGKAQGANFSLKPVGRRLAELLGQRVKFLDDCVGTGVQKEIENMKSGEVVFLENLRFHPGEEANNEDFARELASLAEVYINDAFGTCHREHASIIGVPKFFPKNLRAAGLLLEKEVKVLSKLIKRPKKPVVAIMGGAKVSTKIKLLEKLLETVDQLLVGGVLANTILKAKGIAVGKSIIEEDVLASLSDLKLTNIKLHLPIDAVVSSDLTGKGPTAIKAIGNIADNELILDIGPDTNQLFLKVIENARTIFWNGPVGYFEKEKFAKGTKVIAYAIAGNEAYKVIGGGDVVSMLDKLGVADKMDHISTGGGAMLKFLAGEKLPGIEVLS